MSVDEKKDDRLYSFDRNSLCEAGKHRSNLQSTISLSSGEFKYYAWMKRPALLE